jgi:glutamate synthase (NADPH/NADH) large chain
MTKDDELRLARLIENHRRYTGSERAKAILDNWAAYLPRFVKVLPTEYRKALEAIKPRHIAPHPPEHAEIAVGANGR